MFLEYKKRLNCFSGAMIVSVLFRGIPDFSSDLFDGYNGFLAGFMTHMF